MITIVDYGLGNIRAIINIYKSLNIPVNVASTIAELSRAKRIILPGVGAFDWAMSRLNESGMRHCLDDLVKLEKRPVLGICVGMQMLAKGSEEGILPGLGWVDAEVKKFDQTSFTQKTRLPHMGWNNALPKKTDCLFRDLKPEPSFYFLHSYYFSPLHSNDTLAVTDYNGSFASAIRLNNIFGVQFHPEKSHQWGIQLLKNFSEL